MKPGIQVKTYNSAPDLGLQSVFDNQLGGETQNAWSWGTASGPELLAGTDGLDLGLNFILGSRFFDEAPAIWIASERPLGLGFSYTWSLGSEFYEILTTDLGEIIELVF